jgi:hypothetical protein
MQGQRNGTANTAASSRYNCDLPLIVARQCALLEDPDPPEYCRPIAFKQ